LSRSVDLFIETEGSLGSVAGEVRRVTGGSWSKLPDDGSWALVVGEVEARLGAHRYLDDVDLPLERYRYCLSARVVGPVDPDDAAEAALLRSVGAALVHRGGFTCLLVIDLERRAPLGAEDHSPEAREGIDPLGSQG